MRRETLDSMAIEYRTRQHVDRINGMRELLEKFDADPEKSERIEQVLCKCCYYSKSQIGGQAFSSRQCASCDWIINASSTCVDVLCVDCAERRGLCKRCGADINLKNRRNRPE